MSVADSGSFRAVPSYEGPQGYVFICCLPQILVSPTRYLTKAVASCRWNSQVTLVLIVAIGACAVTPVLSSFTAVDATESAALPEAMRTYPFRVLSRGDYCENDDDCGLSWSPMPDVLGYSESLPEDVSTGRAFDVVVRGQLATPLSDRDYGTQRKWCMLYVFESRYRRTIEKNGGQCIVERRDYENVRAAKLLIPTGNEELPADPFGEWSLKDMEFPDSRLGICLASPAELAARLLKPGNRWLAKRGGSRGFLKTDALSGRSVRFVFRGGVGLESVEAIGWNPTGEQMRHLVSLPPPIEWSALARDHDSPDENSLATRSDSLGDFLCVPGRVARTGIPVELAFDRSRSGPRQRFISANTHSKAGGVLRGLLQYDQTAGCVTSAEFDCQSTFLRPSYYHLFFESLSGSDARIAIRYECAPEGPT